MNVNNVTLAMVNAIARYWAKKLSVSAASGIESIALNATKTALVITYKDGTTSQISSDDLMLTAIYDTTATGIVDNSEKLGGMLPSEFATKANLDNFMSLTQANTAGILYVRGGGLNGDGSLFTPYSSLSDAQTAISATNQSIDILDCGTHIISNIANPLLVSLHGLKATINGTIVLSKDNCFYHVANHNGDIDIEGNNVTVIVDGEVKGNIICTGTNCKVFVNFFDDSVHTIVNNTNIYDGSKIGDRTFGFKAER